MSSVKRIFDGEWPPGGLTSIYCYCTCSCGRKLYMLGSKIQIISPSPDVYKLANLTVFVELDGQAREAVIYENLDAIVGVLVDVYTIAGENLIGVLVLNLERGQMSQQVWRLDRDAITVDVLLERSLTYVNIDHCRIGIGTCDTGYIVLLGKMNAENGEALDCRMIAANPFQHQILPDIDLNKEINELEQMCRHHPKDLYVFPNCSPLVNRFGVFIMLSRVHGTSLVVEPNLIGVIWVWQRKETARVEIIHVDGAEAEEALTNAGGRPMNIGLCSNVSQRRETAWMSFIVPKPETHWRYRLQRLALFACSCAIRFIGRPLVWFARFDKGTMAVLFARTYCWIVGPSLVPNLGPTPDFVLMAMDLRTLSCKFLNFDNDEIFRNSSAAVMVDSTSDGAVIIAEAAPDTYRMRVSRQENPFRIPKLVEIAFSVTEDMFRDRGYSRKALGFREVAGGGCPVLGARNSAY
uniref:MMS1_N domain-containing protein n=1 Tax=Panagrellus redivivus TaxID=6233 RepID=A0A7E4VV72_PANRE